MKPTIFVVDPGHGGPDSGATYGNLLEKDVNLKVALLLRAKVTQSFQSLAQIYLTRESDCATSLYQRCAITNQHQADYYLSIHGNADPDPDLPGMPEAKGEEIWYTEGSQKSQQFAQVISGSVNMFFPDEPFRGIKASNGLYVLRSSNKAPAKNLVELGFIDNSSTAKKFTDPAVINHIADCLNLALITVWRQYFRTGG